MHTNEFLQLADALPEALILLSSEGQIIAANKTATQFLQVEKSKLPGRWLKDFTDSPEDKLKQALRAWSRNRTAIPAVLNWKEKNKQGWRCQGFLLQPATETEPAQLVLRCIPGKPPASEFITLNRELEKQQITLRKLLASRKALEKERELAW